MEDKLVMTSEEKVEAVNVVGVKTEAENPVQKRVELNDWAPIDDQIYLAYINEVVVARFDKFFGLPSESALLTFIINKNHYKQRMDDIVHHINYFINFYDPDNEYFTSLLSMKYIADTNQNIKPKKFKEILLKRMVTPTMITKIKAMANDLYVLNLNTDIEGKYTTTPKITNEHARVILAVSFCMRLILPLCIHFTLLNSNIVKKKGYIACLDDIFMDIITLFEKNDCEIYSVICNFVKYRVDRSYKADAPIWEKKKQLYGINYESYLQELIHEVILVKSLYKLSYNRSIVSFIDGIISNSTMHFKNENFRFKPVEIDADSGGNDNDDYLSQAESIEMSTYRIDESNMLINEVNNQQALEDIYQRFKVKITDEEFNFYYDNCKFNPLTQLFLHSFYSRFFKNTNAIYSINKKETVKLLIILKKYLQLKGMSLLPQICTANVKGRFKENIIKNSKFIEKFQSSSVYQNIIKSKFKYVYDLSPKKELIIKRLSTIINSTFILVDPDSEINGIEYTDVNIDRIIDEYLQFLSII
jgi:hypothetical protein